MKKKQVAANAKLQQMLAEQQETENEKRTSEVLQEQIRKEKKKIDVKKAEIEKELANVRKFIIIYYLLIFKGFIGR